MFQKKGRKLCIVTWIIRSLFYRLLSIHWISDGGTPTCQLHLASFCKDAVGDKRTEAQKSTRQRYSPVWKGGM